MPLSAIQEYPLLINDEWRTSKTRIEIRSPFSGEVVGVTYQATAQDAEAAVDAASRAFEQTRKLPTYRRAEILQKIADGLKAQQESIARLITLEVAKPIRLARAEVARAIGTFVDAAEETKRIRGEWLPLDLDASSQERFGIVRRVPVGPVFAITPFNFPLNLVAHKLAPALACGASIILKPAPQAPLTTLALARIAQEAGALPGSVNVAVCGNDVAQSMATDERLKALTFTGSATVGWLLKQKAGKKRVLLELGGNAGVAIHSDADLDLAADRCVVGGFAYAGQVCISVQRIYVHRPVFEVFKTKLLERVSKLQAGDPLDEKTDIGPMISVLAAERAESWIREAVTNGAEILAGGNRYISFLDPTVLTNTIPTMKVCAEEVFAPIVTLEAYDNLNSALSEINRSPYGLQAGIFTNDLRAAVTAFDSLDVGGLIVNDVPTYRADTMPYGGTKDSGIGREGVRYAIQELTEPKVLVVNPGK